MARYAIGDVHGCIDELKQLLGEVSFNPEQDYLYFTGDVINRGPHSLAVLRFIMDLGEHAVLVLGNHELHFIAHVLGFRKAKRRDTFFDVLNAPDCETILEWLLSRPLIYQSPEKDFLLFHAGLPHLWTIDTVIQYAHEAENILSRDCSPGRLFLFQKLYAKKAFISPYGDKLSKLCYVIRCLTSLRYCDYKGKLLMKEKGSPGTQPEPFKPWFYFYKPLSERQQHLFCGHWSTLGFFSYKNITFLDSGCVYGRGLTCVNIDDRSKIFYIKAHRTYLVPR
ncbi:symmetrical bis(5'-nucleosyl)-tetraphosphatase [Desulfonauticus submarinus]